MEERSYCAEKMPATIVCQDFKVCWELSRHCSGVTRNVSSDRSLLLQELQEFRCCWKKPISAVQVTGLRPQILGWGRFACADLHAASNRGDCCPQNLVVVVQWRCRRATAEFMFMTCLGYMTLFSRLELLWS